MTWKIHVEDFRIEGPCLPNSPAVLWYGAEIDGYVLLVRGLVGLAGVTVAKLAELNVYMPFINKDGKPERRHGGFDGIIRLKQKYYVTDFERIDA